MNARLKLNLDRLTGTFDVDPSSSRIYSRDAAIDLIVHGFDENEVTPANEGGATPPGKPVVQFVNSAGRVVAQAMLVRPTGDGSGAGADGKYDLVATLSTNTVEMRREFFGVGLQAVREFTVRILDTETANPIACGPFPVWNFPGVFGDAPTELPSASEVLAELRRMIEEHAGRTDNPHRVTAVLIEALTQVQADSRYALKSSVTSLSSQVSQALNQSAMAAVAARGHAARSDNPHAVTAEQVGAYTKAESDTKLAEKADKSTTLAGYGITDGATKASLAPEYSAISAYSVGAIVYHDGNIYQCKTEISDGGEAWNPAHWSEAQKLDDFFTNSNSLLAGTIDARLPYPLNPVTDEIGLLKDRAINTTSLASVTVPDNFTDLLVRASVASSLSVTMPAETTKYGDTFPGEAGEYLITITKTGTAEAYVRTIMLEVVA